MRWFILIVPFLLAGCFEENKPDTQTKTECFQILPESRTRQIMLNKCSGETWMLVYTTLMDNGKETGKFTYRWMPLTVSYDEAELSSQ